MDLRSQGGRWMSPLQLDMLHMTASKYFIYLAGRDRAQAAEFKADYLEGARRAAASDPQGGQLIVNLIEDTPEGMPYRPASVQPAGVEADYDVIVALTPPAERVEAFLEQFSACVPRIGLTHIYRVEELVQLDRQNVVVGERSPGIKYIGRLNFHPDLPASAGRRSWDIHAPLALKVHIGMDKYVRNWIVDSSRGYPASGIAELNFPTLNDMLTRYFDSERGREEILQDTSHFIMSGTRFFTGEYVLRR